MVIVLTLSIASLLELHKLSTIIVDLYMYYQNKWQQQLHNTEEDSDMHNILNNRITGCSSVIIKLKDSGYKDKIMKECKEKFYEYKFTIKKSN